MMGLVQTSSEETMPWSSSPLIVCVIILRPLRFGWLLVLGLHKEDYLQIVLKICVLLITRLLWLVESWDPVNRFNHASLVAVVTPTDPKSVRNRCVVEVFGGVFVLSRCFWDFSVGVGSFVIDWVRSLPFSLVSWYLCYMILNYDLYFLLNDFGSGWVLILLYSHAHSP